MKHKVIKYSLCFLILAMCFAVFPIYQQIIEQQYYSNTLSCPELFLNNNTTFTRSSNKWQSTCSTSANDNYKIINGCASNSMIIKKNDSVIGGTSSDPYKNGHMNVYDCNGNAIFKLLISNDIRHVLTKNNTYYSLMIQNMNDIVIGHVNSIDLYTNDFVIFDSMTNEKVINIKNSKNILVLKNESILYNPILLSSIIGYVLIAADKGIDIQNLDYCVVFFDISIFISCLICLILITILMYKIYKKKCKNGEENFEFAYNARYQHQHQHQNLHANMQANIN